MPCTLICLQDDGDDANNPAHLGLRRTRRRIYTATEALPAPSVPVVKKRRKKLLSALRLAADECPMRY